MIRIWFRTLISYLRTPPGVHSVQAKNELREEIEFHLSSSIRDHIDAGMSKQKSQQAALKRFGDVSVVAYDCSEVSISRHVFWHRLHQAFTMALIGVVGFLASHALTESETSVTGRAPSAMAASGFSLAETNGDIRGSVVGDHGEAVSSAHVLVVVKTWPPNGFRQQSYMATTRPDGTFLLEDVYPPEEEYEVQIAAIADGRLLQSQYITMTTGKLDPLRFQLKETTPFVLRFESGDGEPIAGVSVFPAERVDGGGHRHCVYFSSADPIVRESSATGNVSIPHFLPGEQATVYVRFPDSDWERRRLVVPKGENVMVLTPTTDNRLDDG